MKLSKQTGLVVGAVLTLLTVGCGQDVSLNSEVPVESEGTKSGEFQAYLQDDLAEEQDETVPEEDQAKDNSVFETLRALHEAMRMEIAECGGFADEAAAIVELREEIRSGDEKPTKEQWTAMKEAHIALRTAMKQNLETIKGCFEIFANDPKKDAIDGIHTDCLKMPGFPPHPPGIGPGFRPRLGRGKRPPAPPLNNDGLEPHDQGEGPDQLAGREERRPKPFKIGLENLDLDSSECVAAVELGESLL